MVIKEVSFSSLPEGTLLFLPAVHLGLFLCTFLPQYAYMYFLFIGSQLLNYFILFISKV